MSPEPTVERSKRKIFSGIVVSDRMNKTRVVEVSRLGPAPFLREDHPQEQPLQRARRDQPVP